MAPPQTARRAPIATRGAKARIARERITSDTFAAYCEDIAPFPLLSRDEEKALGWALIAGRVDIGPMTPAAWAAREKLTQCNLRLVIAIAAVYADQGVPFMDIIGAGNIGLIRAVDKYVPGRARFGTHAAWWIREACSRYVMATGPIIHLPRAVMTARHRLHKVEREAQADGAILDDDQVASATALTPAQVKRARTAQEHVLSLDAQLETTWPGRDGELVTLADTLADTKRKPVDDNAADTIAYRDLYQKLATVLTAKERLVVAYRFGLGELGGVTMTHPEIGKRLGMNRESVRQVEIAALAKLRVAYTDPDAMLQGLLFA